MKMFKNITAILLAVLMLAFAVSCTSEKKTTDDGSSSPEPSVSGEPSVSAEPTPVKPSLDVVDTIPPDVQEW